MTAQAINGPLASIAVSNSNELTASRLLNIPQEHQEKPDMSLTELVVVALKQHIDASGISGVENHSGLLASEIAKVIMEMFPYYRYCSSRWKLSLRTTLQENCFSKVEETNKGCTYSLNKHYIANDHDLSRLFVRL